MTILEVNIGLNTLCRRIDVISAVDETKSNRLMLFVFACHFGYYGVVAQSRTCNVPSMFESAERVGML